MKKFILLPGLFIFVLLQCSLLVAQSTGYLDPTSTHAPFDFTDPQNAFASDDVWTSVPHGAGCRCPWFYLSWDGGNTYTTNSYLAGPFGTTDGGGEVGAANDDWGHAWTESELGNNNFVLKIANPGISYFQGYSDFNFNLPAGALINGIKVLVEEHGDDNFTMEYIDHIAVNVFYTAPTIVESPDHHSLMVAYPNPATDNLNIVVKQSNLLNIHIKLADASGRILYTSELENSTTRCASSINTSHFTRGVYLLSITCDETTQTKKIVLE